MPRSFGPIVYHNPDGSFRPSCMGCVFRTFDDRCNHNAPLRRIPDPKNTPDWCEMREDMLRDARDAARRERDG